MPKGGLLSRIAISPRAAIGSLLVCALACRPIPLGAQGLTAWQTLNSGIGVRRFIARTPDDTTEFELTAVRIDPRAVRVRVVDVLSTLGDHKSFHVYDLREVALRLNPSAIINGGFTASLSLPIPVGLLVVDQRPVSQINKVSSVVSGIFCVRRAGIAIVRRDDYVPGECVEALQAGPLLVEQDGRLAINRSERANPKYRRSAVAIDRQGRLLFIATNEVHLYDLARVLASGADSGGLDCVAALNLSGSVESGLLVKVGKANIASGSQESLIASAIAVFHK